MKSVYGFILILLLMNCSNQKTIGMQGHRGCRGLMPENSIPAFKKAIEIGVQTLELDVVVSKDNVVVVSHEPFISRLYCLNPDGEDIPKSDDKRYNLYQMTYDSIKQFDCGSKFFDRFPNQEKIQVYKPSLDEVMRMSKSLNPNIKFNIELKARPEYDGIYAPKPNVFVKLVLDVIHKNDAFGQSNIQSFDLRILEETKKQAPEMVVAILIDGDENMDEKLNHLSFKPEIISPYFELLTPKNVKDYQKQNFKVIPWTVNEKEDLQRMIDFQVDAIITDYPDRLASLLK